MIGFVIISHRDTAQLLRLVTVLNSLYDDPPIACHHDASQASIDLGAFPKNVVFVLPSIRTRWAKWAVVGCVLRALEALYASSSPEWFVLLSAADYPSAPSSDVICELTSSDADAFIDFRKVGQDEVSANEYGPRNPQLWLSETYKGQQRGWKRYLSAQFWLPVLRRELSGRARLGKASYHASFQAFNLPFSSQFSCYHGDFWFAGNRKAASVLLNPTKEHQRLQRFLKLRTFPEECYFQTVLCNDKSLKLNRDDKRFCIWRQGADHPQELGLADLPEILASSAHFARKFRHGDPVLDEIDAALGRQPSGKWAEGFRS